MFEINIFFNQTMFSILKPASVSRMLDAVTYEGL